MENGPFQDVLPTKKKTELSIQILVYLKVSDLFRIQITNQINQTKVCSCRMCAL